MLIAGKMPTPRENRTVLPLNDLSQDRHSLIVWTKPSLASVRRLLIFPCQNRRCKPSARVLKCRLGVAEARHTHRSTSPPDTLLALDTRSINNTETVVARCSLSISLGTTFRQMAGHCSTFWCRCACLTLSWIGLLPTGCGRPTDTSDSTAELAAEYRRLEQDVRRSARSGQAGLERLEKSEAEFRRLDQLGDEIVNTGPGFVRTLELIRLIENCLKPADAAGAESPLSVMDVSVESVSDLSAWFDSLPPACVEDMRPGDAAHGPEGPGSLVHVTAMRNENHDPLTDVAEEVATFVDRLQARCSVNRTAEDDEPWISHAALAKTRQDAEGRRTYVITFVWHRQP